MFESNVTYKYDVIYRTSIYTVQLFVIPVWSGLILQEKSRVCRWTNLNRSFMNFSTRLGVSWAETVARTESREIKRDRPIIYWCLHQRREGLAGVSHQAVPQEHGTCYWNRRLPVETPTAAPCSLLLPGTAECCSNSYSFMWLVQLINVVFHIVVCASASTCNNISRAADSEGTVQQRALLPRDGALQEEDE